MKNAKIQLSDPQIHSERIRQSIFFLGTQLFMLELLIGALSMITRIPIVAFGGSITSSSTTLLVLYVLLFFFTQIVNIIFILLIVLRWFHQTYQIVNDELVIQNGIITIQTRSYTLKNVQSVYIQQDIIGRLFKYGTVQIYSPLFQYGLSIPALPYPEKFVQFIKDVSDEPKSEHVAFIPRK